VLVLRTGHGGHSRERGRGLGPEKMHDAAHHACTRAAHGWGSKASIACMYTAVRSWAKVLRGRKDPCPPCDDPSSSRPSIHRPRPAGRPIPSPLMQPFCPLKKATTTQRSRLRSPSSSLLASSPCSSLAQLASESVASSWRRLARPGS
jgi:hypothetical protein